ncbi:putative glutamate-1-semialdehyde 2,1-aminomutase [Aspergillus steynii IBT 23096]|uniref:Putative glutamate-1-semialdehyde 2,1-aminomutase n=1 Tax=Aspergillus steynii IBT 23096 TaxID=1392250 RepID=A0A2I2GSL3_9EURO|nr:putative glutamate-1-semialdehyde 2,1-aminomutase [Aspergillus steynii IBT 23096]PLB55872.1 putative glutamate-1-semialdehyde 2,1-aminomutase [Aspergillus steynii IBT 23096]
MTVPSDPESSTQKAREILLSAQQRYEDRNPVSKQLHEEATEYLPGGNTRSVLHTSPFPICMKSGYKNRLVDHDGHEYLDFLSEMTAGLYGHSHPKIREAVISTTNEVGLNLGASTGAEVRLAKTICDRIASVEQVRFCNSGTEANLYALSVARQVTGRSKVIVFEGGYHGGVLYFGHGIAANNVDKEDWILGQFNDVEGAKQLIAQHKEDAAAVLVEPMQGSGGCIPGTAEFLHSVQDAAKENGLLFILDEVITFRLAPGGLQSRILHPVHNTPLSPDLTTLGKSIAGGMTIGAFGGRRELLSVYDPRKAQISHSGTFNNNSLAMNVGHVALSSIYTPDACVALNSLGDELRHGLQELARGTKMVVTGLGAVLNIHFLPQPDPESPSSLKDVHELDVSPDSTEFILKDLLWFHLLEHGIWIARRGMVSLNLETTREDVQTFLQVVGGFLKEFEGIVRL